MLAAGVVSVFAVQPWKEAFAACNATVNGQPMSAELCALATRVYGSVAPGHYWVDDQGNWGRVGSQYAEGNLSRDQRRGGQAWTYRGSSGGAGSDGEWTYFNFPGSGSVMTGNCD